MRESEGRRTRVSGTSSEELRDGSKEEEIEIGERRCARVRLAQPQLPPPQQEVLQLFEELFVSSLTSVIVRRGTRKEEGTEGLTVN